MAIELRYNMAQSRLFCQITPTYNLYHRQAAQDKRFTFPKFARFAPLGDARNDETGTFGICLIKGDGVTH